MVGHGSGIIASWNPSASDMSCDELRSGSFFAFSMVQVCKLSCRRCLLVFFAGGSWRFYFRMNAKNKRAHFSNSADPCAGQQFYVELGVHSIYNNTMVHSVHSRTSRQLNSKLANLPFVHHTEGLNSNDEDRGRWRTHSGVALHKLLALSSIASG